MVAAAGRAGQAAHRLDQQLHERHVAPRGCGVVHHDAAAVNKLYHCIHGHLEVFLALQR